MQWEPGSWWQEVGLICAQGGTVLESDRQPTPSILLTHYVEKNSMLKPVLVLWDGYGHLRVCQQVFKDGDTVAQYSRDIWLIPSRTLNGHLFTLPKIVEVTRSKHMSMSNVTGEPTSFAKVNGEAAALSMYLNSVDQALVFQHFVDMFIVKGCSFWFPN